MNTTLTVEQFSELSKALADATRWQEVSLYLAERRAQYHECDECNKREREEAQSALGSYRELKAKLAELTEEPELVEALR